MSRSLWKELVSPPLHKLYMHKTTYSTCITNPQQGCLLLIFGCAEEELLLLCENSLLLHYRVLKVKCAISKDKQTSQQSCMDMIRDSYTGMFNFPLEEAS